MWEKFFVMVVDDMKWLENCIDLNYIFLNLILVLLYWKVCIVNKMVRLCKFIFIKYFYNNIWSEREGWNGKFFLVFILMIRCIKVVYMNCGIDNFDSY